MKWFKNYKMNSAFILSLPLTKGNQENQATKTSFIFLPLVDVNWDNKSIEEDFNDTYRKFICLFSVLLYFIFFFFFLFIKNSRMKLCVRNRPDSFFVPCTNSPHIFNLHYGVICLLNHKKDSYLTCFLFQSVITS